MRDRTYVPCSGTLQEPDAERVAQPSPTTVPAMSWDDPESRPAAWAAFGASVEGGGQR